MAEPLVSVLMPVYNGGPYLADAIQCILDQTFSDFELIIINDGSTDESEAVIKSFSDPRIRYTSQKNQGLAATLNNGLAVARGKWIARQDQDDVSLPERFAKQLAFLEAHPDVGLLGTCATVTNARGKAIGAHDHPTTDGAIRYALLFDSPFVHASIMGARSVFQAVGGYDTDRRIFEDYDMWSRMVRHTKAANLPDRLVRYREVSTSISRVTTTRQDRVFEQRLRNMRAAFPTISEDLVRSLGEFGYRNAQIPVAHFKRVHGLLSGYLREQVQGPELRPLQKRLRHGMLGYRLMTHRTLFHRLADRVLKEALLL